MPHILFHPDVKQEIRHSFEWYQAQSLGLGQEFINELEESFEAIKSLPLTWPQMGHNYRRYVLSRFPYSVIYKAYQKRIFVVAVMHNHQKPGYWQDRS